MSAKKGEPLRTLSTFFLLFNRNHLMFICITRNARARASERERERTALSNDCEIELLFPVFWQVSFLYTFF